ncbi:dUTPase [Lysinibacillus sp. 2017]|uniref:dUTP diphosphatase n=1 Tax=unclassified Lysinibacillus TaxID=2636778 RepID=UPI000D526113|nr:MULTISPECIES: dUTP diphosphatase [unclassified Lysinibacillus]AWE08292.1 dUTPase [Lysinibacillus sp. 2017]TGN36205.1 dUTPase [Lysinibacillus sp. S2017]
MEFKQLFEMQRELDYFIEQNQNVDKDVFEEKGLALLVELAELANETRCFKFWSTKGPSERPIILEEFVDSIHFMLSLGNMRGYLLTEWPNMEQSADLTQGFINTTQAVLEFLKQQTEVHYKEVWRHYSILAYNLGFTVADIIEAYKLKNEKNYERQRTGY